ncbi:hypothetical protein ACFVVU_16875 [Kitasatospora sp. NPDC057965]|uniref:hypothetical protein n=1 Tax=Kitasatospora sp. NPDC057965 TaxID=3346291 RepID=UPI0036D7A2E1
MRRTISAGLGTIGALALSGCFMSDPEPPYLGFRVSTGQVEVFVPLCQGESITEISGADVTGKRRELFTAARPTVPEAGVGRVVVLGASDSGHSAWVPTGFAERKVHEEVPALPKLLEVSYRSALADSAGVVDTEKAADVQTPGQYWTRKGARTAEQISRQLKCNATR